MGIFDTNNRKSAFIDEIRCDEQSYLIWKWHPKGTIPGNNRENAIRFGSSLRVRDGEVAIFVHTNEKGFTQEHITGPFDKILETANLPIIADIIGLAYDGGTPFQAEIYFINLAQIIQTRFAVPFFNVYDPRFADFGVPVAVRGTITFKIDDYRNFIKLHRLDSFNLDDFQKQIRDTVTRYVKDTIANAPAQHNIPLVQIESKTSEITDIIEYDISERLKETFGVTVSGVDIGAIEIDKTSNEYYQLMSITKNVTTATVQAQMQADIKNIHDKQRIEAENYAETLRMQREETQYAQRKQTQTANFTAYQTEKQAEIGIAGAEALGKMGASGAGNVNIGNGTGFNPAAMMAGMAMGGAIGQNMSVMMNNMMSGINQPPQFGITPPPIPMNSYYVALNGQATGPHTLETLKQMSVAGTFSKESLVWKQGMSEWVRADMLDELKNIFVNVMPPIPNN